MQLDYAAYPKSGLPKAGVVCTYPRALIYDPLKHAGLDIPNLHTEQLVMQIATVL